MPLLISGLLLTAVSWFFAWSHIGILTEYSFFPLWVGYILLVSGLSEVIACRCGAWAGPSRCFLRSLFR